MSDLLQKAVSTTSIGAGGGGILNPTQSNKFIDYIWDATVLGNEGRRVAMTSDTVDLDKIGVGERITRVATERVNDSVNADVQFTKVNITTTKFRLDWELTHEGLEDNIEGEDLEDTVARLMATQLGNDLEDLAINGDSSLTADPLMKGFDGYQKLFLSGNGHPEGSANVVDNAHAGLTRASFNKMIKAMPRKYMQRRNQLRFYTSSGLLQDFLNGLGDRETNLGDNIIFGIGPGPNAEGRGGLTNVRPFGVPVVEVPLYREDYNVDNAAAPNDENGVVVLTFPKNRLWGFKREVTVYREFEPKKDAIEYTVYVRMGVQVENNESVVLLKNVKPLEA